MCAHHNTNALVEQRLADLEARFDALHAQRHVAADPPSLPRQLEPGTMMSNPLMMATSQSASAASELINVNISGNSKALRSSNTQVWWSFSVEDTLAWPSLRCYDLLRIPLIAVLDVDSEDDATPTQYDNSEGASVRLPRNFDGRHVAQPRGGLDNAAEMYQLVDRFLKHIHAKQPILEPSVLYEQIAVVEENGLGWDAPTCLLLLACALGAVSTPFNHDVLEDYSKPSIDAEDYLRGREYFDAGRKRLGLLMEHASIIGVHCLFFAAGYYITIFKPFASWRMLNSASVMCKNQLMKTNGNLNEVGKQTHPRIASPSQSQPDPMAKLLWSCVKTEREVASELGFHIASLSLIDYEDPMTLIPDHDKNDMLGLSEDGAMHRSESLSPGSIVGRGLTAEEHQQSWFYYLTDISLRKLEIQIDAFFQSAQAKPPGSNIMARELFYRDIITTLADSDKQIVDHFSNLPPMISVETDESHHSPDDLREYLRLRMLRIRHDLSRPALYFILHGVLTGLSAPLWGQAIDMANRALSIDEHLMHHGLTTHRHPGTWLGIRYCTRSALELFAVTKASIPELVLPPRWRSGMEKFKIALKYWGGESRDARLYLAWIARLESVA